MCDCSILCYNEIKEALENMHGLYLNTGNELLERAMRSEIYIDKSMIIAELNKLVDTENNYLCVSRPRRFGKSMAGAMIAAYYSKGCDSRQLFDRLKISHDVSYESRLNKMNVIKIDLNAFYAGLEDKRLIIKNLTSAVAEELAEAFQSVDLCGMERLCDMLVKIYQKTGETFILIIDEYDVLVREKVSRETFSVYLEFLNSLFKNQTLKPAISLAYLTGILPIVRDTLSKQVRMTAQSKLNEFDEYSMVDAGQLAEFVGFTKDEVKDLCEKYEMDFAECERWYDGYHLKQGLSIYSPKSVVQSMRKHECGSYWTITGSYEALKDYILMDFDGIKQDVIKMIGGGRVDVDVKSYLNTMTDFSSKDDVFTYLIHLGYLVYDRKEKQCYIPNEEIREEWVISIKYAPDYKVIIEMVNDSRELLERTIALDEDAVAAALDKAHINATNPLTYNDEKSFQSAIGLAYFYANTKYTVIKELPTGKGYADLALIPYLPNIPAMIIELKNKKSAASAIEQIKNKAYDEKLRHYRGNLLFVGVNYDPDTKAHECRIEQLLIAD